MKSGKISAIALLSFLPLMLGGCFTGVESTPRIDANAVKRERAATVTPEQTFLSDLRPSAPSQWTPGKVFRVSDNRISRIFSSSSDATDSLIGTDLLFERIVPARSLTGDDATEIHFRTADGRRYFYRLTGVSMTKIDTLSSLDIPFAIDMQIVESIDKAMRGNEYYIRTSAWYDSFGRRKEDGFRHILVHIDSVTSGDAYFPALVRFSVVDPDMRRRTGESEHAVYMSAGNSKTATRDFDLLFAFESPRKAHPEINDETWDLIIQSKVREGMSRDECRLALGAPPEVTRTPTYGGMRELWSYSDGVFLIFDDGFLTRYRL